MKTLLKKSYILLLLILLILTITSCGQVIEKPQTTLLAGLFLLMMMQFM